MNKNERKQIADTIAEQLGGYSVLYKMIGARNFAYTESGLSFRVLAGRKISHISITLNGMDTYDMILFNRNKPVKVFNGLYADNLIEAIENYSGLSLRMPKIFKM